MRESMAPSIRARWADLPATDAPMTFEEFLALPDDRWRFELMAGRLALRAPGDLRHGMIASALALALRRSVLESAYAGSVLIETGFVVSATGEPDTVLVPAVALAHAVAVAANGEGDTASILRVIPALVAEITAPNQSPKELGERARRWLAAGVQVVWVVWPARHQVDVWRRTSEGDPAPIAYSAHENLEERDILPDFSYPVAHLFI